MNVSETKTEGLVREYQIVITAAEIDAEVTKKLEEILSRELLELIFVSWGVL